MSDETGVTTGLKGATGCGCWRWGRPRLDSAGSPPRQLAVGASPSGPAARRPGRGRPALPFFLCSTSPSTFPVRIRLPCGGRKPALAAQVADGLLRAGSGWLLLRLQQPRPHACRLLQRPAREPAVAVVGVSERMARQRHRGEDAVGGYYDPAATLSISGGQLHIRMFRGEGAIHSAAVVPKASIGLLYGKYVETFRVSDPLLEHRLQGLAPALADRQLAQIRGRLPRGRVGQLLLRPRACPCRGKQHQKLLSDGHVPWGTWNTTAIEWWPNNLAFYLNGTEIYHLTGKWVPDERMSWIIQNETALNGEVAPENSSGQLNISHVAIYAYAGQRS